jgi:hypothetical protein
VLARGTSAEVAAEMNELSAALKKSAIREKEAQEPAPAPSATTVRVQTNKCYVCSKAVYKVGSDLCSKLCIALCSVLGALLMQRAYNTEHRAQSTERRA